MANSGRDMKIALIDINGEEVDIQSDEFSREIDMTQKQETSDSVCSEKVCAWLQQHPSVMITMEFQRESEGN